ncbi:MAG TPA: family 20 glycosylhydrolase, partial [bacterium]|nr:family 20 glycosylhydrolase [bacterium]
FISFAADSGYNAVLLYLEGRVRTKSFPYPAAEDSYSEGEMGEIVEYASKKRLEIIPATQTLAHAEQFLRYALLQPLSELRETNLSGRWDTPARHHDTFCPSLRGTREFLAAYLEELATIFPAPLMHVGLDEAWHIGICNLCQQHPEGQAGIFLQHINWLYSVVAGKLGKRMMLWDDMFQHYPEVLPALPKDILLCCWEYGVIGETLRWHFGDQPPVDKLKEFSSLGFECLTAPADMTWLNPVSFTRYAEKRPCLGGLLTMWEKYSCFYHASLPVVAATGRLWSGSSPEEAFPAGVRALFGVAEPVFLEAIRSFAELSLVSEGLSGSPENYLQGGLTQQQAHRRAALRLLSHIWKEKESRITTEQGRTVLQDILGLMEQVLLRYQLVEVLPAFYQAGSPAGKRERQSLANLCRLLEKLREQRRTFWKKVRPGIPETSLVNMFDCLLANLTALLEKPVPGVIKLKLFLTGIAQDTEVLVKLAGTDSYQRVLDGRLTSLTGEAFYQRWFVFPFSAAPEQLRLETRGYGTQGFCYVEIINQAGHFVPDALVSVKGQVLAPWNILKDSNSWVLAGEGYTRENFLHHQSFASKRRHGLEIKLREDGSF